MGWGFSAKKYKTLHLQRAVTLPEEQLAESCESKKELKVTAGKISQVVEFLYVRLLSNAGQGSRLSYFWMCTYEGMIRKPEVQRYVKTTTVDTV